MSKLYRLLLIASLLLAMALVSVPAFAQGGTPISYGQVVTGQITSDAPEVFYTFQGNAGDVITISMTATVQGLDSFLELRSPGGASLLTDDDSGGNLNSLIGPYTLLESGAYTIVATRFMRLDGSSTGPYELVVSQAALVPLTPNETVTLELNDSQPVFYLSYTATPGQVFSLDALRQGGDMSFFINVRDSSGGYVNQTYSTPDGSALLDPLSLNQDTYTFVVARQQDSFAPGGASATGVVRVALTLRTVETQPIAFDAPVSGTLNDANPSDHLAFNGTQGDLFRLTGSQLPGGLPFEVQLVSPNGYVFNGASTAYSEQQGSFVLDPLQLEGSGQFLIVVRRSSPDGQVMGGSSGYTITLSQSQTPSLAPGVEVTGSFDGQTYEQVYRYEGVAGQRVRITLRSLDNVYAPSLDVQGPAFGQPGMEGMGGGGPGGGSFVMNVNSAVPATMTYEVALPATGVYLFRVHNGAPFAGPGPGAAAGSFGLLIEVVQ